MIGHKTQEPHYSCKITRSNPDMLNNRPWQKPTGSNWSYALPPTCEAVHIHTTWLLILNRDEKGHFTTAKRLPLGRSAYLNAISVFASTPSINELSFGALTERGVSVLEHVLRQECLLISTLSIHYPLHVSALFWHRLGKAIVTMPSTNLRRLRLIGCDLGHQAMKVLSCALHHSPQMEVFEMHACQVGYGQIGSTALPWQHILSPLSELNLNSYTPSKSLHSLVLEAVPIGDEGIVQLVQGIMQHGPSSKLARLDLRRVGMTVVGANALVDLLRVTRTLRQLDLSFNFLGNCGGKVLASHLSLCADCPLLDLCLDSTGLGDEAMVAMADMIKTNDSLKSLHVKANKEIGPLGVAALLRALAVNHSLQHLHVGGPLYHADALNFLCESKEHPLDHVSLQTASLPYLCHDLRQRLAFVCARNRLLKHRVGHGVPPHCWALVLARIQRKEEEGASVLFHWLRSELVVQEWLSISRQ